MEVGREEVIALEAEGRIVSATGHEVLGYCSAVLSPLYTMVQ